MLKRISKYLLLTIFIFGFSSSFAASVKVIKPYVGTLQKSFTEPAKTHLQNTYTITMPISGKLERVEVREGDRVKKGQIVAKLEQKPLVEAVNKAQANLKTITAELVLQQKTVKRYQKLIKQGYINQSQIDQELAKENVLKSRSMEAKSEIAITKYDLAQSELRSPIDGVILYRYNQGGKWLQTGEELLMIGDLTKLEVICDVLSQEAQELKIGDPVVLTSVGTTVILHGKVKQIYPAGFTKKSSLGVDEQRVNVVVSVKEPEKAKLGLDYRVQAKFLVGAREGQVLIVPRFSVLQDSGGNYYVFVVKGNRVQKRIVKLGILTDEKVSILSGLTKDEAIVDQPTAEMQDGMKI